MIWGAGHYDSPKTIRRLFNIPLNIPDACGLVTKSRSGGAVFSRNILRLAHFRDGFGVNEFTFAGRARCYSSNHIRELNSRPQHRRMETGMFGDGGDASHCSSGLSADNYRSENPEDRATFRRWMRGVMVFYAIVFMLSGTIAIILNHGDAGLTQFANLYAHVTAGPPGSNTDSGGAIRPPAKTASAWW
jgi:hypothetical protein